jgi:two-component system, sensor histidine kinase and response regulator
LAQAIHDNRDLCRSMVMMLTSGDRPGDIQRCDQLGVAAYLIKPVKQSELLDAILIAAGGQSALTGSLEKTPGSSRSTSQPKSILLAEDSLINQKLAIGLLEKWGHRVTVADDGLQAVKLSSQQNFDVILMDVQMPEMDGLDATRTIRHREQSTGIHLPIIAMTAHAMKGDRERCLEAGMDDYLMKPIRAEQLFHALERIGVGTAVGSASERASVVAPTEEDRVNWDLAHQAVNQDTELLRHVAEAFLEECPQLLDTMRESIESAEWKRFQRAAHTMKSGLRMFGISTLADDVENLEMSAKSGKIRHDIVSVMDKLKLRTGCILSEMESYLKSSAKNGSID